MNNLSVRGYANGNISIKGAGGTWTARLFTSLDTVFLFFCFDNASSNINTSDVLFVLDDKVRPKNNMNIPGFVISQVAMVNGGNIYERHCSNTQWSAWQKL